MKQCSVIVIVLIGLLMPGLAGASGLGDLRISLLEGDVQVKTEEAGEWVPAAANMPLRTGDRIWVPDRGRMEIQMRDGSFLRLDERTSLEVFTLEQDSSQFYLSTGRMYVNYRGLKDRVFQVDTPDASLRVYDRAVFNADVSEGGYTNISVYRGALYAETQRGRTRVAAGKSLALRGDDYAEIGPLGPGDAWERWNRDRDRVLADRRYSSRYLPDELEVYSSDFDEYGKWVYVRDYGYVWTPTVYISVGWSPYRHGRWVWIGGDYVWIAYEPWGWAPYHYGRWTFIASFGWCWVPPVRGTVYWSPGYVAWVYTPTYVAWVPLAPGEIYYGYGYYGPHSVNILNIDIRRTEIRHVYRNIHVANAVTVLNRDTFVTGRPTDTLIKENPFLRERISVGRPDIKPEARTFMPVLKDVPRASQPPQAIRDLPARELKEKRPLVRDRSASVLRPESTPKPLPLKPSEKRAVERGTEMRRETMPAERKREIKPKESRPLERKLERPGEAKPLNRGVEKRKETARPPEAPVGEMLKKKAPVTSQEKKVAPREEPREGKDRGGELREMLKPR